MERLLLCHLRSGLRDAAREGWMESSFFLLSLCILISTVFSPTPFAGMKISFQAKIFWYKPEKLNPINKEMSFQSDSLFFNKVPERESLFSYSQMMSLFSNSRSEAGEVSGAQVLPGVSEGAGIVYFGEKEAEGGLSCSPLDRRVKPSGGQSLLSGNK